MNNNQDNSKDKSQTFQVGLMQFDNKDIMPLEIISKGIIHTDNALGLNIGKATVETYL